MKRILAIVEIYDDTKITTPIDVEGVNRILPVPRIHPSALIDPDLFLRHWEAGIHARQDWETFNVNFFQMLTQSGFIDENGLHIDEYTPGSICRYIIENEKSLFTEKFRGSMFGMIVLATVKQGGNMIRKGKKILVDWVQLQDYARPMTEVVLQQMMQSPERAAIMQPIFDKYATEPVHEHEPPIDDAEQLLT